MILLNDDEIIKGINDGGLAGGGVLTGLSAAGRKEHLGVAKSQLKKVAKWGEETCPHEGEYTELKRRCYICWQALLEEAK